MSNLHTSGLTREETGTETAGKTSMARLGSWSSVLYLARGEMWKNRRSHLIALAVALVLSIATAFIFGAIPGSPSGGSPATAALNIVFVLCIVLLPRFSAWASGDLSNTRRAVSPESHIAFLKTLPLTFWQIVPARTLVAISSVLVLLSVFLGSFYALSEPLRDGLGVGGLLLFAAFWIGCALAFEAVSLFMEFGTGDWTRFSVYLVLGGLSGGLAGGYGAIGVNMVAWVIELIQSRGVLLSLAVLLLGGILLALSWVATTWRLSRKGVGS